MADAPRTGKYNGGEATQERVLTAVAIAAAIGGELRGDPAAEVTSVASVDRAQSHQLSFLANAKYAPLLAESAAGIVLITPELADTAGTMRARVIVANPYEAMLSLLADLYPQQPRIPGVHATAVIGRGVVLGEEVTLDPYVVIGDGASIGARVHLHPHVVVGAGVQVGDDCELFAGVTLYPGTILGQRVRAHAGARLGSDGFGYVFRDGAHAKIPHVGRCVVESDVEIGANTTIDRGSIDDTVIGAGTKIDNLVQIAHNVRIGRLCLLVSQCGIAGSVRVEDGCILGGQVGVSGHHTIGRGARLAAQAGVFGDIPAGETWSGYPARPHRDALRAQAALFKLPSIMRVLQQMADERKTAGEG
ncbi:MAG: UDP-3-O-(3-hydroxymyristoyl)glucosamine N-acyltransferase [bacterium]